MAAVAGGDNGHIQSLREYLHRDVAAAFLRVHAPHHTSVGCHNADGVPRSVAVVVDIHVEGAASGIGTEPYRQGCVFGLHEANAGGGVHGQFHNDGQVVGVVVQGVEHGGGHGVVAVGDNRFVVVVAVVAEVFIAALHIAETCGVVLDIAVEEDIVETVVEAAGRGASRAVATTCGLRVVGRESGVAIPAANLVDGVVETYQTVAVLGKGLESGFSVGVNVEIAHHHKVLLAEGVEILNPRHQVVGHNAAVLVVAVGVAGFEVNEGTEEKHGVAPLQVGTEVVHLVHRGVADVVLCHIAGGALHLAGVVVQGVHQVGVGGVGDGSQLVVGYSVGVHHVVQQRVVNHRLAVQLVYSENGGFHVVEDGLGPCVFVWHSVGIGWTIRGYVAVIEQVVLQYGDGVLR